MESYQQEFIQFAIKKEALCFGEFKLKSGRISPYFFNSGRFNDGESLTELGRFYAAAVAHSSLKFDMIYGPAYKGIPLATTMAVTFWQSYQSNYSVCFNRKEIKDHGEGGLTFGAEICGNILIIDDVISAGTSVRESVKIISAKDAVVTGIVVALDRQECGLNRHSSAIEELEQEYHFKIISIVSLDQIMTYLAQYTKMKAQLDAIQAYHLQYGIIKG